MDVHVLFDLDGVLVDNCAFESAVTNAIVAEISEAKSISFADAMCMWHTTLAVHAGDAWWPDYGYHCEALGLPKTCVQVSHERYKNLLRLIPRAIEALAVATSTGPCWLASDAMSWVADFKLRTVGISTDCFEQRFTLDRCKTNKGDSAYWKYVLRFLASEAAPVIYIDDRLDRLVVAATVLPNCRLIHATNAERPGVVEFGRDNIFSLPTTVFAAPIALLPEMLAHVINCFGRF